MKKHIQTSCLIRDYFNHFFEYAAPADLSEEYSEPVLGRSLSDDRAGWFWFLSEKGYFFFDIKKSKAFYYPETEKKPAIELINGLNEQGFPYPVYEVEFVADEDSRTLACEVDWDYKGPYILSDVAIIPYPRQGWNDVFDD